MPRQLMKYHNTCVIIDCIGTYLLTNQHHCSIKHIHHNALKELIDISLSGSITFVSGVWDGGCVSDRVITAGCCIVELLKPVDNVMADKGFDIQGLLGAKKIKLNIPPFPGNRQCFPPHVKEK